jgi:hypothetical protein
MRTPSSLLLLGVSRQPEMTLSMRPRCVLVACGCAEYRRRSKQRQLPFGVGHHGHPAVPLHRTTKNIKGSFLMFFGVVTSFKAQSDSANTHRCMFTPSEMYFATKRVVRRGQKPTQARRSNPVDTTQRKAWVEPCKSGERGDIWVTKTGWFTPKG